MFGLIDGNSFYCSCERAFDPKLWGKPLVVLSNNDGCAIARTPEAKKLGVKMGAPWHLIKGNPAMKTVKWRSSNYELYGDMSRRMYQVLEGIFPEIEAYSIDEMFADLRGLVFSGPSAFLDECDCIEAFGIGAGFSASFSGFLILPPVLAIKNTYSDLSRTVSFVACQASNGVGHEVSQVICTGDTASRGLTSYDFSNAQT
jgi:nucleotidyltransferase/DNA polymerase involved in DNA repair